MAESTEQTGPDTRPADGAGADAGSGASSGAANHRDAGSGAGEQPVKRRRRKRTAPQEKPETATLEVTASQPAPKRRRRKPTAKRMADAASSAEMILDVVDGIGQEVAGDAGAIAPLERGLMQDPLARILARQDPAKL